jgi:hypothetical protein
MEQATFTAFAGTTRIAHGDMAAMIAAQRDANSNGTNLLIFDDATGAVRDVDVRPDPPAARGRPKLGVTSREITLLPRHWDWLARQKGGASVMLRKLVNDAIKAEIPDDRLSKDAAYRFLQAIAGDFAGYENVLRALFAGEKETFSLGMTAWPRDVRTYAQFLAGHSTA